MQLISGHVATFSYAWVRLTWPAGSATSAHGRRPDDMVPTGHRSETEDRDVGDAYTRVVTWSAPLLALLGTIVGASVTLLADRIRWRRDRGQRRVEALRNTYGTYLAALHATSEELRSVSLGEHAPQTSRSSAARAAFRVAQLNACREQLVLLAPREPTVRVGDETFTTLRELRDAIGQGSDVDSPDYRQILKRYQGALYELRNVMRADLGSPPLDEVTF